MNLSIKNLRKKFGDKVIFNDFSYSFSKTGIYVIKGASGIGKTTLLRIIAGLDNEFEGTVENGGIHNVSFMFQEYRLFPTLSALENTLIADDSNEALDFAKNLLTKLGISEPDFAKSPSELSGGMKQRIAFARAILRKSPILILDEPTKELDEKSVSSVLNVIANEAKNRLVLLVTHENLNINENTTVINL